jgi:hypothetical protein
MKSVLEGGEGVLDLGCVRERSGAMEEGTVRRPNGEDPIRRPFPHKHIITGTMEECTIMKQHTRIHLVHASSF